MICVDNDKDQPEHAHNTVNTVRNVHLHLSMTTPTILDGFSTVHAYRNPLAMNTLDYCVEQLQVLYPLSLGCLYHWLSCYSWW